MNKLFTDYETYSEASLLKVGAWAYSVHPSTEVLMMAWAFNDEPPKLWLPGVKEPGWVSLLHEYAAGIDEIKFQIHAWNDFFEYCIMRNVQKWPVPPPEYWADTAAKAAALALPRSLGECGEALGLSKDAVKDKEGKKLISIFCGPKKSAKKANKGELIRTRPEDKPELFEQFKKYCIQDVVAERNIDKILPDLQPQTRKLWELDRKINLRGVHFDMNAVDNALATIDKAKKLVTEKVAEETCGMLANINSPVQFLAYMETIGTPLENSQKEYLKRTVTELEEVPGKEYTIGLIKLRLKIARSSLAKYGKLGAIVDRATGRAYGLLRFHGASTGRWSGNLFQPQNLPNESLDLPDLCVELLEHRDPEIIDTLFGDCLEAISLSLRSMMKAPPGYHLVVSDFAQIESRVLAWLAGAVKKLDAYREKLDIYKVNAAAAFKTPYEEITKSQRQIGKVIELACGYQGGINAFRKMAKTKGVVIPDDEAKKLIENWRLGNSRITSFWTNVEATAIKAVEEPGTVQKIRGVRYRVQGSGSTCFLFCYLPSGRRIAYHKPRLVEGKFGRSQIEYWGINSLTKKYCRKHTYGGKLVENITQAVAMDCMSAKMFEIDAAGYPIVLTVHDEIVTDTPIGHGSIEHFNSIMETVPSWAESLPVAADGYEAMRYKK